METHDPLEQWVNRHMAASQPPTGWPDQDAGRRQLARRLVLQPHRVVVWVSIAAAVCASLFVLPQPRAAAQRIWDQVVLGRLKLFIADYGNDGAAASVFSPDMQRRPEARPVVSLEEASRIAGFSPRLPAFGIFAIPPGYSVADVTSATLRLRTPAIRSLVAQAGGSPGEVPDSWNGAVLEVRVGPVIVADFGGILLLQSPPSQLRTPPDFDLALFYRIAFRSLGINEREARALSADLSVSPALLTFMPKEDKDLVHEFKTRSGIGIMIEEVYGPGKIAAVWSGKDRLYALFPAKGEISREFVMEVADALE